MQHRHGVMSAELSAGDVGRPGDDMLTGCQDAQPDAAQKCSGLGEVEAVREGLVWPSPKQRSINQSIIDYCNESNSASVVGSLGLTCQRTIDIAVGVVHVAIHVQPIDREISPIVVRVRFEARLVNSESVIDELGKNKASDCDIRIAVSAVSRISRGRKQS